MRLEADGAAELAAALARPLIPALSAATLAIAADLVDRLAPYPPAPGRRPNARRWYERGYGWRTKGGGGDQAISEQMNRRWDVQGRGLGAVAQNLASYSGRVQAAGEQADIFKAIGWKTDEEAVQEQDQAGVPIAEIEQAIRRALGGLVEG